MFIINFVINFFNNLIQLIFDLITNSIFTFPIQIFIIIMVFSIPIYLIKKIIKFTKKILNNEKDEK